MLKVKYFRLVVFLSCFSYFYAAGAAWVLGGDGVPREADVVGPEECEVYAYLFSSNHRLDGIPYERIFTAKSLNNLSFRAKREILPM